MSFTPVLVFSVIISLYGLIAKRTKLIHWMNSMTNVISQQRRSKIDWDGYSVFFGNLFSIVGFLLVFIWIAFSIFNILKYYSIVSIAIMVILLMWGLYGYALRRFDTQAFSDEEREKMRIKVLEYYNLDLIFSAMTFILIILKLCV